MSLFLLLLALQGAEPVSDPPPLKVKSSPAGRLKVSVRGLSCAVVKLLTNCTLPAIVPKPALTLSPRISWLPPMNVPPV